MLLANPQPLSGRLVKTSSRRRDCKSCSRVASRGLGRKSLTCVAFHGAGPASGPDARPYKYVGEDRNIDRPLPPWLGEIPVLGKAAEQLLDTIDQKQEETRRQTPQFGAAEWIRHRKCGIRCCVLSFALVCSHLLWTGATNNRSRLHLRRNYIPFFEGPRDTSATYLPFQRAQTCRVNLFLADRETVVGLVSSSFLSRQRRLGPRMAVPKRSETYRAHAPASFPSPPNTQVTYSSGVLPAVLHECFPRRRRRRLRRAPPCGLARRPGVPCGHPLAHR